MREGDDVIRELGSIVVVGVQAADDERRKCMAHRRFDVKLYRTSITAERDQGDNNWTGYERGAIMSVIESGPLCVACFHLRKSSVPHFWLARWVSRGPSFR